MALYKTGVEVPATFKITYGYPLKLSWSTELPPPPSPQPEVRIFHLDFGAPLVVGLNAALGATSYWSTYAYGAISGTLLWPVGYCGYPVGISVEAWGPYGGYDVASYEETVLPPGTDCFDTTPSGPWSWELAVEGYFEVVVDCIEVIADYVPDNAIEIDGTFFPETAAGVYPDGLPAKGGTQYLIPKIGGNIVTTNTSNGVTATVSEVIDEDLNLASYRAYLLGLNQVLNTESAALSGVATFDADFTTPKALAANLSASSGGCVISWNSSGAWSVAATGVDEFDDTTATLEGTVAPTTPYTTRSTVREIGEAGTEAYPNSLTLRLRHKDLVDTDRPLNPSDTYSWDQYDWAAVAKVDGSTIGSGSVDEVAPVKAYLLDYPDAGQETLSTRGEDVRDFRWQFQMEVWSAIEIEQDASLAVASIDASVTQASPNVILSETNWEGYRYASIPYVFTDARTLTFSHGAKEYDLPVTNGSGTVLVDLLFPNNVPGTLDVDERDGRWPLESGPLSLPDVTGAMSDEEQGWLFGTLERPTAIGVGGIEPAETLSLGPVSLTRETSAYFGVYLPFQAERKVWDSETDTTYGDMDLWCWSDGRTVGPIVFRFHVVPISGDPSYAYETIDDVASFINGSLAGWTATVQAPPSGAPYDPDVPSLKIIGGWNAAANLDGYVYDPGTESWVDQTYLAQGSTLLSCVKLDEFGGWPREDPWELSGSKILRGLAHGQVFTRTGGARRGATNAVELVKSSDSTLYGRGSTNLKGSYRTRTPWAPGDLTVKTRLRANPAIFEEWTSANRYPGRTGLFGLPATGWGDNWNLHTPWGNYHQLGWRKEQSLSEYQRAKFVIPPFQITTELAEGDDEKEFRAAYLPAGPGRVAVTFSREGDTYLKWTDDDGATISSETMVLSDAIHPTIAAAGGMLIVAGFRYDEGEEGPGTIVAKALRPGPTLVWSSEFTFKDDTATPLSVEDDTFHFSPAPEGPDRLILVARKAGDDGPTAWYSSDYGYVSGVPQATWIEA